MTTATTTTTSSSSWTSHLAVEYKGACAYEVKLTSPRATSARRATSCTRSATGRRAGFRKGKAPRAPLERRFAKTVHGRH